MIGTYEQTPWEKRDGTWIKRDDLFVVGDTCGGKARTTALLVGRRPTARGIITASLRTSSSLTVVAAVASHFVMPCRIHIPAGPDTDETRYAESRGAELVRHRPGYGTVVAARARADARERDWVLVPYQMQCAESITATSEQVHPAWWPPIRRLVVPVGSGMTLAGILYGLDGLRVSRREVARRLLPVVGVVCGAPPDRTLDRWAPPNWRDLVTLVPAGSDYGPTAAPVYIDGLALDTTYEAKCLRHIESEDGLWVVGRGIRTPKDLRGGPG